MYVSTLLEILLEWGKWRLGRVIEIVSTLLEILPLMLGGFPGF